MWRFKSSHRRVSKAAKNNNQRAFIGGAWSDSGEDDEENNTDETCLVAQASIEICLGINLEPDEWIKDNGCSKHMTVEESLNVTFDETSPPPKTSPLEDDDLVEEETIEVNKTKPLGNDLEDKSLENNEIINIKEFKSHPLDNVIGSLLYLTASSPDIMFSVCLCVRFQKDPKTSHLEAVKRIFRYIKGTTHLGLWYPKGSDIETILYAEFDHAVDYVDRKSTSGICTFMGCYLTSWFSKKQTALAISTTEAEYVSAGKACQQALWMKQALVDYGIMLDDIPIMCDNKEAIVLNVGLAADFLGPLLPVVAEKPMVLCGSV
ncbi:hypothetical protein Tco_1056283 [Tanacetum coccineum]|uniref:Copia protein n=1 Tax=Tanacetum coccineum TaxID=301880 RepID=A0ABQ5H366_9ASTR